MSEQQEIELQSEDLDFEELDDPFQAIVVPLSQNRKISTQIRCVVPCPRGEELVDPDWLEEQTVVMSAEQLKNLLFQETLLANLHTRPTQRSMQAVVPPSSRPDPASLITVLEKP